MIILLAADLDDARRWYDSAGRPDVPVVTVLRAADVRADVIEPGARVVRTDRVRTYDPAVVSALAALHQRIGLVDPTGLLGPLDPDRRNPPDGTPPIGAVITGTRKQRNIGTSL